MMNCDLLPNAETQKKSELRKSRQSTPSFLVSAYVVLERLSVMHGQGRLQEIFDQIAQNTPVMEFGSEHHHPHPKN